MSDQAILTGVFAQKAIDGVFAAAVAGNIGQVGIQALAVGTAIVYSGVMSFALLKLIALVMPLRATAADEAEGLDVTMHGEEAYLQAGSAETISAAPRPGGSTWTRPVRTSRKSRRSKPRAPASARSA